MFKKSAYLLALLIAASTLSCNMHRRQIAGIYTSKTNETLIVHEDSSFIFKEHLATSYSVTQGNVSIVGKRVNLTGFKPRQVEPNAVVSLDSASKLTRIKIFRGKSNELIPIAYMVGYKNARPDTVMIFDGWLKTASFKAREYDSVALVTVYYKNYTFKQAGTINKAYTIRFFPTQPLFLLEKNFYTFVNDKKIIPKLKSEGRDKYTFKKISNLTVK